MHPWFNAVTPEGVYVHGARGLDELAEWVRGVMGPADDVVITCGARVAAVVLADGPVIYLPGYEPRRKAA
jgi:hypothetical protein